MKTLVSEHAKVVNFYNRNLDVFNYPGQYRAARFAFTEIAEAVDARIRAENQADLRRTEKQLNHHEEIGDTMVMLMAALGLSDDDFANSMHNIRYVLGRQHTDQIDLINRNLIPIEVRVGVDRAIADVGAAIAKAMASDDGTDHVPGKFVADIVNAIGMFDWSGDRMDRSLAKLENRCLERRSLAVANG